MAIGQGRVRADFVLCGVIYAKRLEMRSGFNWVDDLSPEVRNDVVARARTCNVLDGTLLLRQGDVATEVFQIISGEIRQFVLTSDGQEVLLYVYCRGDVVADGSAIDGDPCPVTITTRGATTLRVWSIEDFTELRRLHPQIDTLLAMQISRRLRATLQVIERLVTLPVAARIASHIAELSELHGMPEDGGSLELSKSDLALMLGTTRQSVSVVVNELKSLGLIDTKYGKVVVQNLGGLRRYVDGHRHNS
ncbi:Crp/Fnr family transcriptional regulator [Burkholderia contaminans]|nr:Crp/Fnr family transcriptional regulator [Burkholderia contaminans]